MDPFSLFIAAAILGAVFDRSDEAEARRRAILGGTFALPNEEDGLLFDLFVQLYRETGDLDSPSATERMYAIARENRLPGEMVSKMAALVRRCVREDRLQRRAFKGTPEHPRHYWTRVPYPDGPNHVHLVRLVYVDLLDLQRKEGRAGLDRYNAMRDYVEKCSSVLVHQYDQDTHEYWAWVPAPNSPTHMMGLRQWNTILKKWPDMVEYEVASDEELKRRRKP